MIQFFSSSKQIFPPKFLASGHARPVQLFAPQELTDTYEQYLPIPILPSRELYTQFLALEAMSV